MLKIYSDAWAVYGEEAANLIQKYKPKFILIINGWSKKNPQAFDDMWDILVERLPRWIELWDPTQGQPMMTYIFYTLQWNCSKYWKRKRTTQELPEHTASKSDTFAKVEMDDILDNLDGYDRWLLECRFLEDYSFREIAEHLGISCGLARKHVADALGRAKDAI